MMNGCEDGSCENSCNEKQGCAQDQCGYEQSTCGHHHGWSQEDMAGKMMHLAKEAKMELIKEKMKKRLEAVEGKKLDKLADLVVDTMLAKYKLKGELMKKHDELGEKWEDMESQMHEIFSEK